MTAKPAADSLRVPMLDLCAQYAALQNEIQQALAAVLESQQFILGREVQTFEREMAAFCGVEHAVGLASGTDALILSLHAAGVGRGDEVVVPAFSYVATADCVSLLGATPVFADILPDTFNIDPADIEARITSRTRAIVPVHLYGQTAEMDAIVGIARRHGLAVVEDNAQAIGATHRGRRSGSLGDAGCVSFYPTKNLGAYGDGGMVVTQSGEFAARLRSLRGHGTRAHRYISEEQGWNSRLDELQAAVLRVKLRHLEEWTAARQARAARYSELLGGLSGVITPRVAEGATHVFHQYTLRIAGGAARRDAVQKFLASQGVASTVYYPLPLHLQPMFASLGYRRGSLPAAERAAEEALCIPIYPELSDAQQEHVAKSLVRALEA
jgi:dTDP-4-amino-4,6-dideoxygalactose transaminase